MFSIVLLTIVSFILSFSLLFIVSYKKNLSTLVFLPKMILVLILYRLFLNLSLLTIVLIEESNFLDSFSSLENALIYFIFFISLIITNILLMKKNSVNIAKHSANIILETLLNQTMDKELNKTISFYSELDSSNRWVKFEIIFNLIGIFFISIIAYKIENIFLIIGFIFINQLPIFISLVSTAILEKKI